MSPAKYCIPPERRRFSDLLKYWVGYYFWRGVDPSVCPALGPGSPRWVNGDPVVPVTLRPPSPGAADRGWMDEPYAEGTQTPQGGESAQQPARRQAAAAAAATACSNPPISHQLLSIITPSMAGGGDVIFSHTGLETTSTGRCQEMP